VSQRFRSRGAKTVIGGLHVTAVPDEAARYADTIVIGEGEAVWNTLVSDAASGRMRPIYDARTDDVDLARVPVPRYDLLDAGRYNRLTIQTLRGCPWRCEFCASSILLTPRYKQRCSSEVPRSLIRPSSTAAAKIAEIVIAILPTVAGALVVDRSATSAWSPSGGSRRSAAPATGEVESNDSVARTRLTTATCADSWGLTFRGKA